MSLARDNWGMRWKWVVIILTVLMLLTVFGVEYSAWHHPFVRSYSISQLDSFALDQRNGTMANIPQWIRGLDGKTIVVTGGSEGGFTQGKSRLVVYSGPDSGFLSSSSQAQQFIVIDLSAAKVWGMHDDRLDLVGRLHVRINHDSQGLIESVFQMDVVRLYPWSYPIYPPIEREYPWTILCAEVAAMVGFTMFAAKFIVPHMSKLEARKVEGLCENCGYDMRANPSRCSECGWVKLK